MYLFIYPIFFLFTSTTKDFTAATTSTTMKHEISHEATELADLCSVPATPSALPRAASALAAAIRPDAWNLASWSSCAYMKPWVTMGLFVFEASYSVWKSNTFSPCSCPNNDLFITHYLKSWGMPYCPTLSCRKLVHLDLRAVAGPSALWPFRGRRPSRWCRWQYGPYPIKLWFPRRGSCSRSRR